MRTHRGFSKEYPEAVQLVYCRRGKQRAHKLLKEEIKKQSGGKGKQAHRAPRDTSPAEYEDAEINDAKNRPEEAKDGPEPDADTNNGADPSDGARRFALRATSDI